MSYIAQTLNMSEYMVSNGLAYWVKEGVLMELTKTLYIVNDDDDEEEGKCVSRKGRKLKTWNR